MTLDPALLTRAIAATAPAANAAMWSDVLHAPMQSSGIVTPRRAAAFIGMCAEETGFRLDALTEVVFYSSAERIHEVWPERFPTLASAAPYVAKPAALANCVYAHRGGNGDEASGDGWRFRGRGLLQITFRSAYTKLAAAVGKSLDGVVDWVATPQGAAQSACWYWTTAYGSELNKLADAWYLETLTQRINGGLGNMATRRAACDAALAVLLGTAPAATTDDLNAAELTRVTP